MFIVHRYLVTGTDTDVGKTRVAAALAAALRSRGEKTVIVKLVQTGLHGTASGDAARAGAVSQCPHVELARFQKAADPWSAALAEGMPPVHAEDLARVLNGMSGSVVAEGAGGLAVPLNRSQNFAAVAALAKLDIILAVGLRLGCMNHALLTVALCDTLRLSLAGCVLVDRWGTSDSAYIADVRRVLQGKVNVLGILPFDADEAASVQHGIHLFSSLV
jgi:dethiobiotin synthetase